MFSNDATTSDTTSTNSSNVQFRSQTLFGKYEKLYRRPPNVSDKKMKLKQKEKEDKILSQIIDFNNINNNIDEIKNNLEQIISTLPSLTSDNIIYYKYKLLPGLYYFPNYLSYNDQVEWVEKALVEFSAVPYNNLTNLHGYNHNEEKETENNKDNDKNENQDNNNNDKDQHNNNQNNLNLWNNSYKNNDLDEFHKLTWSNIGIQYDWTPRQYNLDVITLPIPKCIIDLCAHISKIIDKPMIPQTSIINYFQSNIKRPMGGHRDAAEKINVPLISISLGCDAIFLISLDDDIIPTALYIRSGDVLVMSDECRFAIHAVVRVVPNTCPIQLLQQFDNKIQNINDNHDYIEQLKFMKKYIEGSRINLNVRQVI